MAKFNERLKALRLEAGLSQQELADQLRLLSEDGKGFSKSSINMYERGEREPGIEALEVIADYFNTDMDYLTGQSEHRNKVAWLDSIDRASDLDILQAQIRFEEILPIETRSYRMVGEVACGEPIFCNEEFEMYVEAGTNVKADCVLKARGDSMTGARIYDGDIVFIRYQDMVNNGEIAAVIIEDSITLKRVYYYPDKGTLILKPENPHYEDQIFMGEELNQIRIFGKAVAFQSDVR